MKFNFIKINKFIKIIKDELEENNISEFAAETAFFTVLSLVPFIIFFVSIFQYMYLEINYIDYIISEIMPIEIKNFILKLIRENFTKSVKAISVSGFIALWSSSKGVFSLLKALRKIYKIEEYYKTWHLRIESCIYTFFICTGIMMYLRIRKNIDNFIFALDYKKEWILSIITKFKFFVFLVIIFFILLFIYKIISKQYFISQIKGAIFSSFALYTITYIISFYNKSFNNFSNMYGSLTSIVLIMLWIYWSIYILLIGGIINRIINDCYKKI